MIPQLRYRILPALTALALTGCSDAPTEQRQVVRVDVGLGTAAENLTVGRTVPLVATVRDAADGAFLDRPVSWTATPAGRVTLLGSGERIDARLEQSGEVTLRATADGASGELVLTIRPAVVARVAIEPQAAVTVGTTVQLRARTFRADDVELTGRTITWTGSSPNIATVTSTGTFTAHHPGQVIVVATSEGITDHTTITIVPAPVVRVEVSGAAPLVVGSALTLTARTYGAGDVELTGRTVAWSSANEHIATVTQAGVVTGVSAGTTQIRVGSEGVQTTVPITVELPPAGRMLQIVAGLWHACGLVDDGTAWCWGSNLQGQLGDGTTTSRSVATRVVGDHTFTSLAAGFEYTCGVTQAGAVLCWGSNVYGQLGDGTTTSRKEPTPVVGMPASAGTVAAGTSISCAIAATGGAAWCWGSSGYGQAGTGEYGATHIPPTAVAGGNAFSSLVLGGNHACGTAASDVRCWGGNVYGMVGDGTAIDRFSPVVVSGQSSQMGQVVAGRAHTCGLAADGVAHCWGHNGENQLGTGSSDPTFRTVPAAVEMPSGVRFTRLGSGSVSGHTCGITATGAAWCWGGNLSGQLGNGATGSVPGLVAVQLNGVSLAQVATGEGHTCALTTSGDAYCWGENRSGELGDGTRIRRLTPTLVWRAP